MPHSVSGTFRGDHRENPQDVFVCVDPQFLSTLNSSFIFPVKEIDKKLQIFSHLEKKYQEMNYGKFEGNIFTRN